MAETAPLIVQTPFTILSETLGPGVAKYREGLDAFRFWDGSINAKLKPFDDRIAALTGTDAEIRQQALAIIEGRDAEYARLAALNPPPPNPDDDPGISDDDRRTYHLLVEMLTGRGKTDLENMLAIADKFYAMEEATADRLVEEITREEALFEARNKRTEHRRRRSEHRAKNWANTGRIIGTVLDAIPYAVTQIIGVVVSVATEVAKAVQDVDTARRYAHALRNNANWLVYAAPQALDSLDRAEANLNLAAAFLSLGDETLTSLGFRDVITGEKLRTGIWNEAELAASKKPKVPTLVKWAAYAGIIYGLFRLIRK